MNISSRNFQSREFVDKLTSIIRETRVNPSRLAIELAEGVLLAESAIAVRNLRGIRALGVAIDMDDPGTGYSSLGYLRQFKVDRIKLDRSFIRDLDTDEKVVAVAPAPLETAHRRRRTPGKHPS